MGGSSHIVFSALPASQHWLVWVGTVVASLVALGIGANDVANSWAPVYGAGVVSRWQAVGLTAVFEGGGSILMGTGSANTFRSEVIHFDKFVSAPVVSNYSTNATAQFQIMPQSMLGEGSEKVDPTWIKTRGDLPECIPAPSNTALAIGFVCASAGTFVWLVVATTLKIPVSTTQAGVGAVTAFAIAARGYSVPDWKTIITIVSSWVVAPTAAAGLGALCVFCVRRLVVERVDPVRAALTWIPVFYAITLGLMTSAVFISAHDLSVINKAPKWVQYGIPPTLAVLGFLISRFLLHPWLLRGYSFEVESAIYRLIDVETSAVPPQARVIPTTAQIGLIEEEVTEEDHEEKEGSAHEETEGMNNQEMHAKYDPLEYPGIDDSSVIHCLGRLFVPLAGTLAAFKSFAHGANDVGTAVGPVAALVALQHGLDMEGPVPLWTLGVGAAGLVMGFALKGHGIMKKMGNEVVHLAPYEAFTVDFATVLTVFIAVFCKVSVSVTHTLVGAMVGVGLTKSRHVIDWKPVRQVGICMLATMPAAALTAAAVYGFLYPAVVWH